MQALCSSCKRVSALEVCFECNSALCRNCVVAHYETWKNQKGPQWYEAQTNTENCKRKLEYINPIIAKNLDYVKQIQDQIEETYNATLNKLNQEKTDLINSLNEIKKDNTKFVDFKKKVSTLDQSLVQFKESTDNLYEDNAIKNLVKKFEDSFDQSQKINQEFLVLINSPIKIIEKFDRVPPPRPDTKLMGNLTTAQTSLNISLNNNPGIAELVRAIDPSRESTRPLNSTNPIFPGLPTSKLKDMNIGEKSSNFNTWSRITDSEPYLEISFNKSPTHLTSYRNFMFSVDDTDMLSIFMIASSNEIEFKNNIRLPFQPNSIACNIEYVGLTYNKKNLKSKKKNPTGVSLFKRDLETVDFNSEKAIEIGGDNFKNPIGIALNNDHLFVCDKDLRAIFKIDIKTGMLVKRIDTPNGEPYKISINKNFVTVTDTLRHSLNIYEIETMAFLKDTIIEQPDGKNGPFGICITNDHLIFIKNYADKQLTLLNFDLTEIRVFKRLKSGILGFTILECFNQTLVVGIAEKKGVFKMLCYANA